MFRSRTIHLPLATAAVTLVFALAGALFFGLTPKVDAQAQTQLVPLVTDQTPLALSNQFGVAGSAVTNQAGDYAFLGSVQSAVFFRSAAAAAPVRVMQMGDEVPGFPGSRADFFAAQLKLNNSGLLAFHVLFSQASGVGQGVIFTFDGSTLQRIVSGGDLAPGGGGANFERSLVLVGLNDSGTIAFTAPLSSGPPVQTTLYIRPAGGAPVRVAGLGDAAPGTGGTFGSLNPLSFNNRGEEMFVGNIVGGSGGQGLFIGSTAGVRKVVANGDANPHGGTFSSFNPALLNNSGDVAFQASGGLWINTPANVTSRVVNTGDAVPLPIGGTFAALNLQAFDDAGDLAFLSNVSGSPLTFGGLFRFRPGNPVEVVAYRNQAAAGTAGEKFSNFVRPSINDTGVISFRAELVGGSVLNGIFQQTGSNPPVNIALDGQATTLTGGGTYSFERNFVTSNTQTLNNGSVYFRSDISGGTADYAEFLISGGATTILMNTAEALPAGARVTLRSFRVGAAGDFVGFLAHHTGGRFSIAVHNITNQTTTVLTTEGDTAPGTGGGLLRLTTRNTVFLNTGGTVVFSAQIIGGSVPGNTGIFLAAPGSGLTKVVANGDVAPGTGGRTFSGSSLNAVTPSPINDAGQVVFSTTLLSAVSGPVIRAVFVWSPGTGASKVAAVGDVTSSGGTITDLAPSITNPFPRFNSLWVNSSGQVAFLATTGVSGPTGVLGIYVGTPGGTPVKVVAAGDPGPAGSMFSGFALPGFNESGEVAFMATLTGGPGGGVFVGSISGPPVPLALNGDPAPAGGNFSITTARPDVLINNQHDVAFRANLTGGTADSGYFIRRGPLGTLQAPVLQGQPAPGTAGVFDTIDVSINDLVSENFQLGPAGDLAVQNFYVAGGVRTLGIWHLKPDNTIEEVLVRGTVAPEFGGGIAVTSLPSTAWNSGGRYPVWARVSGGTFTDGIFLFVPTVSTNTPVGTVVPVIMTDSTTGTTPVVLTFASITTAGNTTLTTSSGGPAIPTAFSLGDPPVFYNVETTATFSGSVAVCIDFSHVSFPPGSNLRLLHFDGTAWVDVTTSGPTGNVICGRVNSLSPFTIARLINSPPIANAGSDQTLTCGSHSGATFGLNGSGSTDPDGDTLTYVWKDGNGNVVGTSASLTLTRPLGTYTFTITVTDPFNQSSTATTHVTARDTTPPALAVTLTPNVLWPPDNKLVQIAASIQITDVCDSNLRVELLSITSNEPLAPDDIHGATLNADTRSFLLRATRKGSGTGRIYTVTYRATDTSGNATVKSAQVVVPHDKGQ